MSEQWDAPNQQVVRPDESGPWQGKGQGAGAGAGADVDGTPEQGDTSTGTPDMAGMTKDEMLAHAQELGVTPANHNMTKDELRAAIDEHQAG